MKMCSHIYFYVYNSQFLLLTLLKIRCEKVKSKEGDLPLLIIIRNNNFEKLIWFLIQKNFANQTSEYFISIYMTAGNRRKIFLRRKVVRNNVSGFQSLFLFSVSVRSQFYHGDIILNRSNNSVFLLQKSIEIGNLNEARKVSSPGFSLKMLDLVFQSIYLSVNHTQFLLQLFLIGFCLFCSKIGKG